MNFREVHYDGDSITYEYKAEKNDPNFTSLSLLHQFELINVVQECIDLHDGKSIKPSDAPKLAVNILNIWRSFQAYAQTNASKKPPEPVIKIGQSVERNIQDYVQMITDKNLPEPVLSIQLPNIGELKIKISDVCRSIEMNAYKKNPEQILIKIPSDGFRKGLEYITVELSDIWRSIRMIIFETNSNQYQNDLVRYELPEGRFFDKEFWEKKFEENFFSVSYWSNLFDEDNTYDNMDDIIPDVTSKSFDHENWWLCLVFHYVHRWSRMIRKYIMSEDVDEELKTKVLRKCINYLVIIYRKRIFAPAWHMRSTPDWVLEQGLLNPRGVKTPLLDSKGVQSKNTDGQKEFVRVEEGVTRHNIEADDTDKLIYMDIIDYAERKRNESAETKEKKEFAKTKKSEEKIKKEWTMVRASFVTMNEKEIRCYAFSGDLTNKKSTRKDYHDIPLQWWKEEGKSKYAKDGLKIYFCDITELQLSQNMILELFKALRPHAEKDLWNLFKSSSYQDENIATSIMGGNRSDLFAIDYRNFWDNFEKKKNENDEFIKAYAKPILYPIQYENVKHELAVCPENRHFKPNKEKLLSLDRLDNETKRKLKLIEVIDKYLDKQAKHRLIEEIEKNLEYEAKIRLTKLLTEYFDEQTKNKLIEAIKEDSEYKTKCSLIKVITEYFDGEQEKNKLIGIIKTEYNWENAEKSRFIEVIKEKLDEYTKCRLTKVINSGNLEYDAKCMLEQCFDDVKEKKVLIERIIKAINLNYEIKESEDDEQTKNNLVDAIKESSQCKAKSDLIVLIKEYFTNSKQKKNKSIEVKMEDSLKYDKIQSLIEIIDSSSLDKLEKNKMIEIIKANSKLMELIKEKFGDGGKRKLVSKEAKNKLNKLIKDNLENVEATKLIKSVEADWYDKTATNYLLPRVILGNLSINDYFEEIKKKVIKLSSSKLAEHEKEFGKLKKKDLDSLEKNIKQCQCGEDNVLTKLLQQYLSNVTVFNLSPVTFIALDGNHMSGKPFCKVCNLKVRFYTILPFMLQDLGMTTMGECDEIYITKLNNLLIKMNPKTK